MSYHIYNTKGIILSERPVREADRIYSILTRDLGLIRATALGVRKINSKLRGALEPISLSAISLVRGKEYWRITSAEFIRNISGDENLKPLALLEKLVQGEDPHQKLFDAIEENLSTSETHLVAIILFHLGYLQESDLNLGKKALIKAINNGIQASQLT